MKWITVLNSLTLILFTVLFFADYFPKSIVAETIPQGILLLLLIGTLIGKGYLDKHAYSLKDQIISFLYMIFLMSLFTFLGGNLKSAFLLMVISSGFQASFPPSIYIKSGKR